MTFLSAGDDFYVMYIIVLNGRSASQWLMSKSTPKCTRRTSFVFV